MDQYKIALIPYRIKRTIGRICIGIVIGGVAGLIYGFLGEAGCSIIQTSGIVFGIALFILICSLAVKWGNL